tara:strand:- start:401 stop:517 length:117 start_codon:yes stop_codon:yes gene_type:complete
LDTIQKNVLKNIAESFMDFNSLVENYVETVEKEVMMMF